MGEGKTRPNIQLGPQHKSSHKPGTSSEPQSTKAARQRKLITTKRIGGAVGHGAAPHSGPLSPLTQLCVTRVDLAKPFLRRSLCRVARSTTATHSFSVQGGARAKD